MMKFVLCSLIHYPPLVLLTLLSYPLLFDIFHKKKQCGYTKQFQTQVFIEQIKKGVFKSKQSQKSKQSKVETRLKGTFSSF